MNRFLYGRGTYFKEDFVDYIGNNCYIPTSGQCFLKRINFLTGKYYTEKSFIRTEQRRLNVMTSARIQQFFRKYNINIGDYNGFRVCPRNNTERNMALKIHNIDFCLIWKSNNISFNQEIKELKDNFKVIDNFLSDKHVVSFFKYEYKPKKSSISIN